MINHRVAHRAVGAGDPGGQDRQHDDPRREPRRHAHRRGPAAAGPAARSSPTTEPAARPANPTRLDAVIDLLSGEDQACSRSSPRSTPSAFTPSTRDARPIGSTPGPRRRRRRQAPPRRQDAPTRATRTRPTNKPPADPHRPQDRRGDPQPQARRQEHAGHPVAADRARRPPGPAPGRRRAHHRRPRDARRLPAGAGGQAPQVPGQDLPGAGRLRQGADQHRAGFAQRPGQRLHRRHRRRQGPGPRHRATSRARRCASN